MAYCEADDDEIIEDLSDMQCNLSEKIDAIRKESVDEVRKMYNPEYIIRQGDIPNTTSSISSAEQPVPARGSESSASLLNCLTGNLWKDQRGIGYRIEGTSIKSYPDRYCPWTNTLQTDALCTTENQLHWHYCCNGSQCSWKLKIPDDCDDNIKRIQWLPEFQGGETYEWCKTDGDDVFGTKYTRI